MPATQYPNTALIGAQIVNYLATLTYPNIDAYGALAGLPVYAFAQLEAIKDVTNYCASGGACVEVYANDETSERRGFGGRMWDTQAWYILSLCSLDTAALAAQIYTIRDALVYPFQLHATLGTQVSNLFQSMLKPTARYLRIYRNGQWLRAYLCELETKQEWTLPIPPGVIS